MTISKPFAASLAALLAMAPISAFAANSPGFDVINTHASASVERVWTSPSSYATPQWSLASLDSDITPQDQARFTFGQVVDCNYDVMVEFDDGYVGTVSNVNVCNFDTVYAG